MLSVAIPTYRPNAAYLYACVRSAVASAPAGSEVVLVFDAADRPTDDLVGQLPAGVQVLVSTHPSGMVGTWNECLRVATRGLVHILHQDDWVDPSFYPAVLDAKATFPGAALIATAFRTVTSGDPDRHPDPLGSAAHQRGPRKAPRLLTGEEAARFLLGANQHSCGSVVIERERALSLGGFSAAYRHSPDEEAYLRFARDGGIAFVAEPLYVARQHAHQARLRTWLEDDFADSYFHARVEGARTYGPDVEAYARLTTMQRVCSSMVTTAAEGHRLHAIRQMASLLTLDLRLLIHWKPWMTLLVAAIPGAAQLVVRRRRRADSQLPVAAA
jgi:Glycosyl transferase family 2